MSLPVETRCSHVARVLTEPMAATASRVRRWLLVEQPGAWGADAVLESRLDKDVAAALLRATEAAGTRLVLIRQGVGPDPQPPLCRWYAVRSDPAQPGVAFGSFVDQTELLDLDIAGELAGAPAAAEPLFLVCTNGKHDPCCAEWGRPVYRALTLAHPNRSVFECSHIGGDRFAANVVCLPEGIYYGRVEPAEVEALVDHYHQGRLLLERYRGRSCYSVPEQAAEISVRREFEIDTFAGVTPVASRRVDRREWVVTVAVEGRSDDPITADVTVTLGHADQDRPLTCGGDPGSPRTVQVRRLVT